MSQRKPNRPSPTRALSPRELASPRTATLPHAVCGSKGVQVWAAQIVKPLVSQLRVLVRNICASFHFKYTPGFLLMPPIFPAPAAGPE